MGGCWKGEAGSDAGVCGLEASGVVQESGLEGEGERCSSVSGFRGEAGEGEATSKRTVGVVEGEAKTTALRGFAVEEGEEETTAVWGFKEEEEETTTGRAIAVAVALVVALAVAVTLGVAVAVAVALGVAVAVAVALGVAVSVGVGVGVCVGAAVTLTTGETESTLGYVEAVVAGEEGTAGVSGITEEWNTAGRALAVAAVHGEGETTSALGLRVEEEEGTHVASGMKVEEEEEGDTTGWAVAVAVVAREAVATAVWSLTAETWEAAAIVFWGFTVEAGVEETTVGRAVAVAELSEGIRDHTLDSILPYDCPPAEFLRTKMAHFAEDQAWAARVGVLTGGRVAGVPPRVRSALPDGD
ncbi:MAG: hypothetical protein SGPRY_000521 [Prymnesium sp.]